VGIGAPRARFGILRSRRAGRASGRSTSSLGLKAMLSNLSMLKSAVIPQLAYRDVGEAVSWLCSVFGFKERVRIGNHRAQLTFPGGGSLEGHP
jgi:hypothetical protein